MYYVYIVVRHHDNASAQANRVIGQPYALEDEASIANYTRAPGVNANWIQVDTYRPFIG